MSKKRRNRMAVVIAMAIAIAMVMVNVNPGRAEVTRSIHTKKATVHLEFENGTAICNARVKSDIKESTISGTLVLSKLTGSGAKVVKTWNVSSNNHTLDVRKTASVSKGSYRLVLTATVSCKGKNESVMRTAYGDC